MSNLSLQAAVKGGLGFGQKGSEKAGYIHAQTYQCIHKYLWGEQLIDTKKVALTRS